MSAKTIRSALGLLQDDPDNEQASRFSSRRRSPAPPSEGDADLTPCGSRAAPGSGAPGARDAARVRRAVANLLEIEVGLATGDSPRGRAPGDLARLLDEELLEELPRGRRIQASARGCRPTDDSVREMIERSESRRGKWPEIVKRYVEEAKGTTESSFKSSLLVSAAEVAYRYGRPALSQASSQKAKKKYESLINEIAGGLRDATAIDPKNRRAAILLERVYREEGRWKELACHDRGVRDRVDREGREGRRARPSRPCCEKRSSPTPTSW